MAWRRSALLAIAIAVFGSGAPRWAAAAGLAENGVQTATDLIELCSQKQDATQIACKFYIHGALQAAEMMHAADHGGEFHPLFCPPDSLSTDDFVAALRLQQSVHPERKTFPAATVIVGGAIEAYPCTKFGSKASGGQAPGAPAVRHKRRHRRHR